MTGFSILKKIAFWLAGIYLLVICFGLVSNQYVQFREDDETTTAFFVEQQLPIHIGHLKTGKRNLRFVYTGNDKSKPLYVFIHGAPSSSNYYQKYLADTALRRMANLVAIDRPGYGYSGFGEPEPELARQAESIRKVIAHLGAENRAVVLVGASYGTSVACRLAMDYPELADGIVLIAPSLAPGQEKTYFISYLLESPLFTWAQPRMIHSANVEKFAHETELRKMEKRWGEINVPVMYMQGKNDELIYPTNAVFAKQNLVNASSLEIDMIPGRGHLLIEVEHERIKKAIVKMHDLALDYYQQLKVGATAKKLKISKPVKLGVVAP